MIICWDGKTLASDCPVTVVIEGQALLLEPGSPTAIGDGIAAALGAMAVGGTATQAVEAAIMVEQALAQRAPINVTANEPIELHEVQHGDGETETGREGIEQGAGRDGTDPAAGGRGQRASDGHPGQDAHDGSGGD